MLHYFDDPPGIDLVIHDYLTEDHSAYNSLWNRLNNLYGSTLKSLDDLFIETQNKILFNEGKEEENQEKLKELEKQISSVISLMEWELFQFAEYTKPNLKDQKTTQSLIDKYQKNITKIRNSFPFIIHSFPQIETSPKTLLRESNTGLLEDLIQQDQTQLNKIEELEAYDKQLSEALQIIHIKNQKERNYAQCLKLYHLSEYLFSKRQQVRDKIYKIKFSKMNQSILSDTMGFTLKDVSQAYITHYNNNLDKRYMTQKELPSYLPPHYFDLLAERFEKIVESLIKGKHADVVLELLNTLAANTLGANIFTMLEIKRHFEARFKDITAQLDTLFMGKTNYLNILDLSDNFLVDIKYLDEKKTKPMLVSHDSWFNILLAQYLYNQGYFILLDIKNALKQGDIEAVQQIIKEKGNNIKIPSAKKTIDIIAHTLDFGQLLTNLYTHFTPAAEQELFKKIDEMQAWMEKMDIQGLAVMDIIEQLPLSQPMKQMGFFALTEIIFKNERADKSALRELISFYFTVRQMSPVEAMQTLNKKLKDKDSSVARFLEANPSLFPEWQSQNHFHQDIEKCNQALNMAKLEKEDKRKEIEIKVAVLLLSHKELIQYSFLPYEQLSKPIQGIMDVLATKHSEQILETFEQIIHLLNSKNNRQVAKIIQEFNQKHSKLFETLVHLGNSFELNIKDYLKVSSSTSPLSRLTAYKSISFKTEEERVSFARKELDHYLNKKEKPLSVGIPSRNESYSISDSELSDSPRSSNILTPHSTSSLASFSSIDSSETEETSATLDSLVTEDKFVFSNFPQPVRLWHLIDNDYQAMDALYQRMTAFEASLENLEKEMLEDNSIEIQTKLITTISLMQHELNQFKKYDMFYLQNQQRVESYIIKCQNRFAEIQDHFPFSKIKDNPFESLINNINQLTINFAALTTIEKQLAKPRNKEEQQSLEYQKVNLQSAIKKDQSAINYMILAQAGDYAFSTDLIIFDPVQYAAQMKYGQETIFVNQLVRYEAQLSKELDNLYTMYQNNNEEDISYLIRLKNISDFLTTKHQAVQTAIKTIKSGSQQQMIQNNLSNAKQRYIAQYNDKVGGYIGDLDLLTDTYFDDMARTFEINIVNPLLEGQFTDALAASLKLFAHEGLSGISTHFKLRIQKISEQLNKLSTSKNYLDILDLPDNLLVDNQFLNTESTNSEKSYDIWFNIMLSQYLYNQGYFVLLDIKAAIKSGNLKLAQEIIHNKGNSIKFFSARNYIDFVDKVITCYQLFTEIYNNFKPEKELALFDAVLALQQWTAKMKMDDMAIDIIKQLPISQEMKDAGFFAIIEFMSRPEKRIFDAISFYFTLRQMEPLAGIQYLRARLDDKKNEVVQFLNSNPNLFPDWQKLTEFYDDLSNCIQAMTIVQKRVDESKKEGKNLQKAKDIRKQMGIQSAILLLSHANTLQHYASLLSPEQFVAPINLIITALQHKHSAEILNTLEQIIHLADTKNYMQIARVINEFNREHGYTILMQLIKKLGITKVVAFHVGATVASEPKFSEREIREQRVPIARSKLNDFLNSENLALSIHPSSASTSPESPSRPSQLDKPPDKAILWQQKMRVSSSTPSPAPKTSESANVQNSPQHQTHHPKKS